MTNKPNKNTSTSKKKSKNTFVDKKLIVLSIILGIFVLVFIGIKLKEGYEQQQTMKDLDSAGKELRVIYDKLVELNGDNVADKSFRKSCVESSQKYGKGRIVCSVGGHIGIASDIGFDRSIEDVGNASAKSTLYLSDNSSRYVSKSSNLMIYHLDSTNKKMDCHIDYYKDLPEDKWNYNIACDMESPGFLSGYEIR